MKKLFLIPARKGSKGLPGKNAKLLGDKPLIEYSIRFAIDNLSQEDEICISSNDPIVIKIAEKLGVNPPFIRPDILSNDYASIEGVILHALEFYENIGKLFDAVVLLQPTSPFRNNVDYVHLINEFDNDTDMVVSTKISKENPYFTLFEEDFDGFIKKSKNDSFARRQECPIIYALNGAFYLIKVSSIKTYRISEFKKIRKIVMPVERSIDIDTIDDWSLAEFYLNNL